MLTTPGITKIKPYRLSVVFKAFGTGVWKSRKPESGIGTGMGTGNGTGTGTGTGNGNGTGTVM